MPRHARQITDDFVPTSVYNVKYPSLPSVPVITQFRRFSPAITDP